MQSIRVGGWPDERVPLPHADGRGGRHTRTAAAGKCSKHVQPLLASWGGAFPSDRRLPPPASRRTPHLVDRAGIGRAALGGSVDRRETDPSFLHHTWSHPPTESVEVIGSGVRLASRLPLPAAVTNPQQLLTACSPWHGTCGEVSRRAGRGLWTVRVCSDGFWGGGGGAGAYGAAAAASAAACFVLRVYGGRPLDLDGYGCTQQPRFRRIGRRSRTRCGQHPLQIPIDCG